MAREKYHRLNDSEIKCINVVSVSFQERKFSEDELLRILRSRIQESGFPMHGRGLCVNLLDRALTVKLPLQQWREYPDDTTNRLFLILNDLLDGIKLLDGVNITK